RSLCRCLSARQLRIRGHRCDSRAMRATSNWPTAEPQFPATIQLVRPFSASVRRREAASKRCASRLESGQDEMVDSSPPLTPAIAKSDIWGDRWLFFLAFVLAGYAFIGKGFAYMGIPPLYIGEMTYLTGVVVFLRSRCLVSSLATLPSFFLAISMAWVV